MNSPLISKREYFLQTFSAAIERLNEAIQECDEQSYTQQVNSPFNWRLFLSLSTKTFIRIWPKFLRKADGK